MKSTQLYRFAFNIESGEHYVKVGIMSKEKIVAYTKKNICVSINGELKIYNISKINISYWLYTVDSVFFQEFKAKFDEVKLFYTEYRKLPFKAVIVHKNEVKEFKELIKSLDKDGMEKYHVSKMIEKATRELEFLNRQQKESERNIERYTKSKANAENQMVEKTETLNALKARMSALENGAKQDTHLFYNGIEKVEQEDKEET